MKKKFACDICGHPYKIGIIAKAKKDRAAHDRIEELLEKIKALEASNEAYRVMNESCTVDFKFKQESV